MTQKDLPPGTRVYVSTYAAEHMDSPACEGGCNEKYHLTPQAASACAAEYTRRIRSGTAKSAALMPVEVFVRADRPRRGWTYGGRHYGYFDC